MPDIYYINEIHQTRERIAKERVAHLFDLYAAAVKGA